VRALVRNPAAAAALASLGIELHPGDITDKASMRAPMTGADGVFHVAGWYKIGLRDTRAPVAINIDGTRHVLELMQELGIRKGVYTSTLAVNSDTHGALVDESFRFSGRHVSVYDWSKHEAHKIAEDFIARGLPLTIVQPGVIYGPGDTSGVRTMFLQYLQRKLPAVPSGAAYCWAHIDDEVHGHILAMEKGRPGRSYFLAGPPHTIVEALDMAESIYRYSSSEDADAAGRAESRGRVDARAGRALFAPALNGAGELTRTGGRYIPRRCHPRARRTRAGGRVPCGKAWSRPCDMKCSCWA
jgi:nucleoside-diphosphate-sugar epimerase